MSESSEEYQYISKSGDKPDSSQFGSSPSPERPSDIVAELDELIIKDPKISRGGQNDQSKLRNSDLTALLDISQAINSTPQFLDNILQIVMERAIELLKAERGFIMLLDEEKNLQFKTAHNIVKESLSQDDFKISMTIANKVAQTGVSLYSSDAQEDERYKNLQSIKELNLRSIMCVPLKSKEKTVGIVYLDNSSNATVFVQTDLNLFELFASQAAIAIENAKLYENIIALKLYNENVVTAAPIGIIVVDKSFKITIANKSSQDIFRKLGWHNGLSTETMGHLSIFDMVAPEERGRWKKICYQVLFTGKPFEEDRSYHKTTTGELALSLKISPLNSLDDQIIGLVIVFDNITEKINLEKHLMMSEKLVAKGEMSIAIGHELNNFLNIISNNAELLQINLKQANSEKVDQHSKSIVEAVGTMKRFTEGLLDFSKLETEKVEYDIIRLIEDLLFSIRPQKTYSKIKLLTRYESNLPALSIDVGQIQQVILNLLNNAAEATLAKSSEGGVVYLTVAYLSEAHLAEIKISDTGIGIDAEHLGRIFEPHFTTKKTGHGFGLFTCQKIVKNHNGQIKVESKTDQGSTFTVELPVPNGNPV
ncbi:MAG: ATP-binding protein [candidate division Zixibacteria bacterium]|nr:ATP-binding protein [candidate division Zixibacteria bacterium]